MCYVVAKKFEQHGCYALNAKRDKTTAALISYLGKRTLEKGIQVLSVSDMDMFGEYKPYIVLKDEKEFIEKVLSM